MRVRLTVRELMILVMLACLGLAAFRLHPSFGALVSGIFALALVRTYGALNQARAKDLQIPPSGVIRTFLDSILRASTILVVSLAPGLCLIPVLIPNGGFDLASIWGILLSIFVAVPIATLLRRRLW